MPAACQPGGARLGLGVLVRTHLGVPSSGGTLKYGAVAADAGPGTGPTPPSGRPPASAGRLPVAPVTSRAVRLGGSGGLPWLAGSEYGAEALQQAGKVALGSGGAGRRSRTEAAVGGGDGLGGVP